MCRRSVVAALIYRFAMSILHAGRLLESAGLD
jgi:hypothetical protein